MSIKVRLQKQAFAISEIWKPFKGQKLIFLKLNLLAHLLEVTLNQKNILRRPWNLILQVDGGVCSNEFWHHTTFSKTVASNIIVANHFFFNKSG